MKISDSFNSIQLIKFTIPTMVMMIITSIYGVVDGLFISNISGSIAFAAVNLTLPIIMILSSLGFMIGTGGSALVSKTLGEGTKDLANKYFSMLIYFLILCGLALSLFSFFYIGKIVRFVGADDNTIGYCIIYGKILSLFLPFYMLQNAFQNFMIVAEKPDMGLKVTIMAAFTNMILDYLLIPRLNITGAAIATGMGQIVGALIPLIYFFRCKESIHFVKTHLQLSPILKGCFNGSSEMITNLSMSSVNVLYNYQLLRLLGNNGVVAYGIIMYISFIFSGYLWDILLVYHLLSVIIMALIIRSS